MDEAIYGTREIKNFWDAVGRGFISGAARSGIDYLSEALGPQKKARRSPIIPNPAATPSGGMRDSRSGCGVPSPFKNSMGYGSDYGYQYNVPMTDSGNSQEDRKGFSLGTFISEMETGAINGSVSSAAFYGGGKALEALKRSVKGVVIH